MTLGNCVLSVGQVVKLHRRYTASRAHQPSIRKDKNTNPWRRRSLEQLRPLWDSIRFPRRRAHDTELFPRAHRCDSRKLYHCAEHLCVVSNFFPYYLRRRLRVGYWPPHLHLLLGHTWALCVPRGDAGLCDGLSDPSMSRILLILTCTATRPRDQTVEFNEMVSSLGRATEKESRARYCSTLITAGTNAIDELVFGSTIRESLASL